jgi:ABC-type iron transport system FetAB ATPase subunit
MVTDELVVTGLRQRIGERVLFDGLHFTLPPGEILAVQGASGSGKSCLLRILAWLDPPDHGTITLGGRSPVQWGVPRWRRQVAWLAQTPPRYPGTPEETWKFAGTLGDEGGDPVRLAAGWGLPEAMWQQPWARLSGGEAQRAALAIALARRPAVLLLDEPTSALDADAAAAVEADLKGQRAVLVTHDDAQAARLAQKTLRIP